MKIEISWPDKKGFHQVIIDGNKVDNVLMLSVEKLKLINTHILTYLCSSAFEDLYIDIADEIFYRTEYS